MHIVPYYTFMIYRSAGINDAMVTYFCAGLDNGPLHHHRSLSYTCSRRHDSSGMYRFPKFNR